MNLTRKRTVSLPAKQAHYIDTLVKSGTYASASEVVRASLRALQQRDEAIERWLSEDVLQTYDDMKTHPERGIPMEEAFATVRAHHKNRQKKSA